MILTLFLNFLKQLLTNPIVRAIIVANCILVYNLMKGENQND